MQPTLERGRSRDYQFSDGTESVTSSARGEITKLNEIRFGSSALPRLKRNDSSSQTSHSNAGDIAVCEDESEGEYQSDKHRLAKYMRERLISQQKLMMKYQNQEYQLTKHMGEAGLIKLELDKIRVMTTPEPIEDETLLELDFLNYEQAILHPVTISPVESRRNSEESSKTLTSDDSKSEPPSSTRLNLHSENCFACRLAARRESNISDSSNTSASSTMFPPLSKSIRIRPLEPGTSSCSGSAHSSNLDSDTDEGTSNE